MQANVYVRADLNNRQGAPLSDYNYIYAFKNSEDACVIRGGDYFDY